MYSARIALVLNKTKENIFLPLRLLCGRTPVMVASERLSFRECFLSGAVVLVFSVVLLSSFVHVAQALEVNAHRMAIGIRSDGTHIEGNIYWKGGWSHAQFSTEDEEAYVWMNVTLDERMTVTAQWRFPNGSIYQVDEKTRDEGSHYVWFSINIKDYPPTKVLGMWEVEVFADGTPLFTEEFIISQAPTFPWTTILRITGLVVAAIAAPILLVFSRMKRPPPKLSFALSLVGGLMIAISGFFRGALGGEMYVYSTAGTMFILVFGIIPALFLGTAISISALTRRRVVVLSLSAICLLYFMFIYYTLMSDDPRLYVLPFLLAITGSACSILGGLLIRRKT